MKRCDNRRKVALLCCTNVILDRSKHRGQLHNLASNVRVLFRRHWPRVVQMLHRGDDEEENVRARSALRTGSDG